MYKNLRIAIVFPAYNEEKLITKTIETLPDFVDYAIVVNDGSTDNTLKVLHELKKTQHRLQIIENNDNQGVGVSVTNGFKHALVTNADIIGVMAGDAQCDPEYIHKMLDDLIDKDVDYVKANRFVHLEALSKMPVYRRIGNIFITILTKFATGYYSIFDTQNGYGFFTRAIMERLPFELIGKRYDYENTLLIALSIANAKIRDVPVPAIYGEEVSSIKFIPTVLRALKALLIGYWRRIYYKYIVYSFHPIALFMLGGFMLSAMGYGFAVYLLFERVMHNLSPSSGTVMIAVLPIILGFQLLLSAFIMDVNNERL